MRHEKEFNLFGKSFRLVSLTGTVEGARRNAPTADQGQISRILDALTPPEQQVALRDSDGNTHSYKFVHWRNPGRAGDKLSMIQFVSSDIDEPQACIAYNHEISVVRNSAEILGRLLGVSGALIYGIFGFVFAAVFTAIIVAGYGYGLLLAFGTYLFFTACYVALKAREERADAFLKHPEFTAFLDEIKGIEPSRIP